MDNIWKIQKKIQKLLLKVKKSTVFLKQVQSEDEICTDVTVQN